MAFNNLKELWTEEVTIKNIPIDWDTIVYKNLQIIKFILLNLLIKNEISDDINNVEDVEEYRVILERLGLKHFAISVEVDEVVTKLVTEVMINWCPFSDFCPSQCVGEKLCSVHVVVEQTKTDDTFILNFYEFEQ